MALVNCYFQLERKNVCFFTCQPSAVHSIDAQPHTKQYNENKMVMQTKITGTNNSNNENFSQTHTHKVRRRLGSGRETERKKRLFIYFSFRANYVSAASNSHIVILLCVMCGRLQHTHLCHTTYMHILLSMIRQRRNSMTKLQKSPI